MYTYTKKLSPFFLALMIVAQLFAFSLHALAEGIAVGNPAGLSNPPQNFCAGTIDWVLAPGQELPNADPCEGKAGSYDLYQNDQKTTYSTYATLKAAYNKQGAATWFVPAPKVATPPADWCQGMKGTAKLWAVASNEVLPQVDPCKGIKGTFYASINDQNFASDDWSVVTGEWPYKGIGGSFYFEADPFQLWLPIISRYYDIATPPAGWCAGKSGNAVLWTVTAQQILPSTHPCGAAGTITASISDQSYKADSWAVVTDWPYLGIGGSFYFELSEVASRDPQVCTPQTCEN